MDPVTIAAIGSSIFSGMSAARGQERANRQQMEFNSAEAQKQRDFEERMFGSRYQMTRRDLEAANYNPLLAFGAGPGTPTGVAAHAEPKSTTSESSQIFSNSARQAADIGLTRGMVNKVKAETQSAQAQAMLDKQMAEIATSKPGKVLSWLKFIMGSGLGSAIGGIGALGSARRIASAISRQPRIVVPGAFRRPG